MSGNGTFTVGIYNLWTEYLKTQNTPGLTRIYDAESRYGESQEYTIQLSLKQDIDTSHPYGTSIIHYIHVRCRGSVLASKGTEGPHPVLRREGLRTDEWSRTYGHHFKTGGTGLLVVIEEGPGIGVGKGGSACGAGEMYYICRQWRRTNLKDTDSGSVRMARTEGPAEVAAAGQV